MGVRIRFMSLTRASAPNVAPALTFAQLASVQSTKISGEPVPATASRRRKGSGQRQRNREARWNERDNLRNRWQRSQG